MRPEAGRDDPRAGPVVELRALVGTGKIAVGEDVAEVREDLAHETDRKPDRVRLPGGVEQIAEVRSLAEADRSAHEDERERERDDRLSPVQAEDRIVLAGRLVLRPLRSPATLAHVPLSALADYQPMQEAEQLTR